MFFYWDLCVFCHISFLFTPLGMNTITELEGIHSNSPSGFESAHSKLFKISVKVLSIRALLNLVEIEHSHFLFPHNIFCKVWPKRHLANTTHYYSNQLVVNSNNKLTILVNTQQFFIEVDRYVIILCHNVNSTRHFYITDYLFFVSLTVCLSIFLSLSGYLTDSS